MLFGSVHFGQSLTLHQRALVVAATSPHHFLKQKKNGQTKRERLTDNKLKFYTEKCVANATVCGTEP